MNKNKIKRFTIFTICNIIIILSALTLKDCICNKNKKINYAIKVEAVIIESNKEYSTFSTSTNCFILMNEPVRKEFETVYLMIDTKNTTNVNDDEVVEVLDKKED